MGAKKRKSHLSSFIAGITLGAGVMFLRRMQEKSHPDSTPAQDRINKALDRTLVNAREAGAISLGPEDRYVIFSDHHKGARNPADDFQPCEPTYLGALDHYYQQGYTLIILGDAEELWEEDIPHVIEAYGEVLRSESRFHPSRYIRLYGNHDNLWEVEDYVRQHLDPFFPGIQFHHGLVFSHQDTTNISGEVFLAHGHQGTLDSDVLGFLGPVVLPLYRELQNITGLGKTTPSEDACLRAVHDTQMYRWSSKQGKTILIAGHTHRPVWSSRTHLEKLIWELHTLQGKIQDPKPPDYQEQVSHLNGEIKRRRKKYPPCKDTIKTKPCYFNTGCCRYADGDITGIELDGGVMRLVKWGSGEDGVERTVFEKSTLSEIFAVL